MIHSWEVFRGTDTRHYKPWNCCFDSQFNGNEVFFPTEFQHGMFDGGHGAGLDDYWNAMLQNPLSAGGFLWALTDEGVVWTDKNGILDTDGTHGADGIVGPYREKEASFYAIKEIWSPVYFSQKWITPDFTGALPVENRYHYTNLKECRFAWKLVNFPGSGDKVSQFMEMKSGTVNAPDIAPGINGHLAISLPPEWQQYDALYLTATDPHGREIFTWTWPVKTPTAMADRVIPTAGPARAAGRGRSEIQ